MKTNILNENKIITITLLRYRADEDVGKEDVVALDGRKGRVKMEAIAVWGWYPSDPLPLNLFRNSLLFCRSKDLKETHRSASASK